MKKSPELFRRLIVLLDANPVYLEASRALRISDRAIFGWLQASKTASAAGEVESEFLFRLDPDDADEAPRWLHEHVRDAISNSVEQIEAAARHRARDGVYTVAKWQGRTVYKLCDPALADLLGDEWERDANGNRVPEMIWTPPATDLVLGVLAAHARRYRKLAGGGTTVNVNNSAQSNGVLVIPQPKPKIAAPLPVLEVIPEPPTLEELLGEDMPDDEPELRPEAVANVDRVLGVPYPPSPSAVPVPEPPVMIREPAPAEYAPPVNPLIRPRVALTELERDLLTRASAIPGALNRKA